MRCSFLLRTISREEQMIVLKNQALTGGATHRHLCGDELWMTGLVLQRDIAPHAVNTIILPVPSFNWSCRKVLPFSLMVFLASSMSHVEAAVVQVAYRNAKYLWPGFAGIVFQIFCCASSHGKSKVTIPSE